MDYFEQKQIKDFNKKIVDIFNLLTISGKYSIIGSAGLKSIKYVSDYDLDELYKNTNKNIEDKIYQWFKDKFETAEKDPNIFITDFKCGMDSNGEPLRWDKKDMKKGYKIMEDGRKITFQECLNIKTTTKLDMIVLIDGVFTEFSENYFFKFGENKGNFFPEESDPNNIAVSIKHSFDEYMYVERNYFKALKRSFAYKRIVNEKKYKKQLIKLIDFFNTDVGLVNKLRADLDILLLVLDNKFRKPKMEDVKRNINLIYNQLTNISIKKLTPKFNSLLNKKTKNSIIKGIEKIRDILFEYVNNKSLDFIYKNKNLLLY